MPIVQTIVIRYLDKQKLDNLLKTLFFGIDYEWKVRITSTSSATQAYWPGAADQRWQYGTNDNTS